MIFGIVAAGILPAVKDGILPPGIALKILAPVDPSAVCSLGRMPALNRVRRGF
jgi:hypothetical protein